MCRPWPGFHCSNHPSDKVRKISRKLHNVETKKAAVEEDRRSFREENPDTWESSDQDGFYNDELTTLQQEIDSLEEKRTLEMTEFYATPKGKEALTELIENEKRTDEERYDSAAELAAAEERRLHQKKMAKTLNDPTQPAAVKLLRARVELNRSKKLLHSFNERTEVLKSGLTDLQEQIYAAKAIGDHEEVKYLNDQRNDLVKELAYIDKQKKQLHAHIESTAAWARRFTSTLVDKMFNWNDKMIAASFKYML